MGPAVAVALIDVAKGVVAAGVLPDLFSPAAGWSARHLTSTALPLACGLAAVLGHVFPLWLRRGGKGERRSWSLLAPPSATGAAVSALSSSWGSREWLARLFTWAVAPVSFCAQLGDVNVKAPGCVRRARDGLRLRDAREIPRLPR